MILPDTNETAQQCVEQAFNTMEESCSPVALIVKRETFSPYQITEYGRCDLELTREAAIKEVVKNLALKIKSLDSTVCLR